MVSQNRPRAMPILLDSRLNFLWTSCSGAILRILLRLINIRHLFEAFPLCED